MSGSIRLSTLDNNGELIYTSIRPPYGVSLPTDVTYELPHSTGRLALTSEIGVTTYTNSTDNRVITSTGGTGINGEANLTFDGSTLTVNGALTTTGNAKLGDATSDAHTATGSFGISGSVNIIGITGVTGQFSVNDLRIETNVISSTGEDENIELTPNGTGIVNISSGLTTSGNTKLGDTTSDAHTVTGSLGISGSFNILQSAYGAQISSSIANTVNAVVASIPTGSFNGVFFDYTIGLSTTGSRVGTVLATWLPGGTNVEFTDFSTLDMGATGGVSMAADIATGNIRLRANNTSGATVEVRAITRAI
jgi:hypothetical protein